MANNEEQHWWFVVRRTILSKWATQLEAGCAVLDVGAGAGRQSILLKEIHGLAVKSLELSSAGVEYCEAKNLDVIQADATKIPFENEIFDGVIAMDILEHIPDDTKAMQELYRVLKPGGMAILQIPQDLNRAITFSDDSITDEKERAAIFGQYDHVRVYGRDYFDKLRTIGFTVVEEDYTKKISPELVTKYCLAPGEIIPVCFK